MPKPARNTVIPFPTTDAVAAAARRHELASEGGMTVADAIKFSGLGMTVLYERMKSGELAFTKLGRRRLVLRRSLVEMLARDAVGGQ